MTGPQFADALDRLGFNPHSFAVWLGVTPWTVYRWRKTRPPLVAAQLVTLMERARIDADTARQLIPPG